MRSQLADLWALGKPRVTVMNVLMALGGFALASGSGSGLLLRLLAGTWLVVASANALNMVLEAESDKLMARTANRPLPRGRLSVTAATLAGLAYGIIGLLLLIDVNLVTAALGLGALVSYVLIYTPLKRKTPLALLIGALPGAVPPLMGWTAVTGRIDLPGLALFAILVAWQVPHFLAIAMYRDADYRRAGLKTVAAVRGDKVAKAQAIAWCTALLLLSLSLSWMGITSVWYAVAALALGGWFLAVGLAGLKPEAGIPWAKRFFRASLVYLPTLTLILALDVALL